jgi:hypothetical protein
MTVNEVLVLMTGVRNRLAGLKELRKIVAVKESYYGQTNKVVEPLYDILRLDKQIVKLENFILKADTLIKKSNAITEIAIEVNQEELFQALE